MKKVLAIDMGATSIRGILGYICDGKIHTEEVMRFSHDIVLVDGRMRWQWDKIINNIRKCIDEYKDDIVSVGIDTWGVDFGLLDKQGNLIANPISYRDEYNDHGWQYARENISERDLFLDTGTQLMSINTLFQLLALKQLDKDTYNKIDKILMMPDLIQYFLTGNMQGEETIWSTSQILNLDTRKFSNKALELLGLNLSVFPKMTKAGDITGKVKDTNISVVNVCGHDTASAVLITRAMEDKDTMFLSCGTWSLFGVKVDRAELTDRAFDADLTNELGYNSSNLLFKNITGLYLFEKYKAQLEEKLGRKISFDEISAHTKNLYDKDPENVISVDITDPRFASENMDPQREIQEWLKEHGKHAPSDPMDYFAIIYDSLISEYIKTRDLIQGITNKTYHKIHMIGGGAKSDLLCNRIASRMQVELTAGPYEASALGNIIVQLMAMGEFANINDAIDCALNTANIKNYSYK